MKKFFTENGSTLTIILALTFLVTGDIMSDYLTTFFNINFVYIVYFIITAVPVSLSIYFNNKKWKNFQHGWKFLFLSFSSLLHINLAIQLWIGF